MVSRAFSAPPLPAARDGPGCYPPGRRADSTRERSVTPRLMLPDVGGQEGALPRQFNTLHLLPGLRKVFHPILNCRRVGRTDLSRLCSCVAGTRSLMSQSRFYVGASASPPTAGGLSFARLTHCSANAPTRGSRLLIKFGKPVASACISSFPQFPAPVGTRLLSYSRRRVVLLHT